MGAKQKTGAAPDRAGAAAPPEMWLVELANSVLFPEGKSGYLSANAITAD